jgi:MFS family permease
LIGSYLAVPDREGGFGYFAFFFVGPIGGVIGLVIGVWLVLRFWTGYRGLPLAGRGLLVIGAIVAIVAAGIVIRLNMLERFRIALPRVRSFRAAPMRRP